MGGGPAAPASDWDVSCGAAELVLGVSQGVRAASASNILMPGVAADSSYVDFALRAASPVAEDLSRGVTADPAGEQSVVCRTADLPAPISLGQRAASSSHIPAPSRAAEVSIVEGELRTALSSAVVSVLRAAFSSTVVFSFITADAVDVDLASWAAQTLAVDSV